MSRPWLTGVIASAALLTALWLVQTRTRDAATADLGWTLSVGGWGALHAWTGPGDGVRRALAAALVLAWAGRLSWHLLADRVGRPAEDGRYAALRALWGAGAQPRFLLLYEVQVLMAAFLAVPLWALCRDPRTPGPGTVFGLLLSAGAVLGEAAADRQLARHRADPANRGRTCRAGLWRLSRHPNYFFEWLFWWGLAVMGLGGPAWAWTLAGPAAMALFLFKVTGIPWTERQALKSRTDYADYRRTTSMFFPWFPREAR